MNIIMFDRQGNDFSLEKKTFEEAGASFEVTYFKDTDDFKSLVKGKDVIIVDDMIATGGSILDSAKQLKEKMKVNRVFLVATFGLFTKGYEMFDDAYKNKIFDRLYVTNLNYVPSEIKNKPWFEEVDCSMKLANIICNINEDKPIGNLLNAKEETVEKIKKLNLNR